MLIISDAEITEGVDHELATISR